MDGIESLEQTHRVWTAREEMRLGTAVPGALADSTTCPQLLCPLERSHGKDGGINTPAFTEVANSFLGVRIQ